MQAGGFAVLAVGTIVYGRGDEEVEKVRSALSSQLSVEARKIISKLIEEQTGMPRDLCHSAHDRPL